MKQTSIYNYNDLEETDLDDLVEQLMNDNKQNRDNEKSYVSKNKYMSKNGDNSTNKRNVVMYHDTNKIIMSGNLFPIANNYIEYCGEIDNEIAKKMLMKLHIEPANNGENSENKEEIYVMKEILLVKNTQLWKNILFCDNFMYEKPKYIYDPVYEDIESVKIAFAIVHNIKSHNFEDIIQLLKTCVTLNNINVYQEYPTFSSLNIVGKKTHPFFTCNDIDSLQFCLELISICKDIDFLYVDFLIESNIELILSCDDVYPYYQYLKQPHKKSLSLLQLITLTNHFSEINETYTDLIHQKIASFIKLSSFSQLVSILQLSKHFDSLPPCFN